MPRDPPGEAFDAPAVAPGRWRCGACLRNPPAYDRCLTVADYDYPWDGLIAQLKFHDGLDLASSLADLLAATVRAAAEPLPSVVLPVPLSAQRLRERGYNQAWELARRTARRLGCRAEPGTVQRWRHAAPQAGLARAARLTNLRGAFLIEPKHRSGIQGRDVAVVDDVMTSGTTAQEIAHVLKQAGARRVQVWTIARTAQD